MKKGIFNIAFVILAIVAFVIPTKAAEPYLVHRFNPEGVGIHHYATTILQDSKGFIWVGTQDGLYRYDGNECRKMDIPVNSPGYLSIKDLCEDANNDIWIASSSGLSRYDFRSSEIFSYESPEFNKNTHVTKIVKASDNSIVVSARDKGAYRIDTKMYICTPIKLNGVNSYYASSLCSSDDGTIYILVREKGIYSLRTIDKGIANPLSIKPGNPFVKFPGIENLEYYNGKLIAGVADETFVYNILTGDINVKGWSDVNDALKLHDGTIALATSRGLVFADNNLNVVRHYKEATDLYALNDKSIRAVCKDREGNLWVGTVHEGVYVFYRNNAEINYFYPSAKFPKASQRLRTIVEDPDGIIWMGSENGGLTKYDPQSGSIEKVRLPIKTDNILALKVQGPYLWVGSYSFTDPLVRLNRKTMAVESFPEFSRCVYHIETYAQDTLMVSNRNGISFIDLASGKPKEFFFPQVEKIRTGALISAPDSSVWTGGQSTPLFNFKQGRIRYVEEFFSADTENLDMISSAGVQPLMFDRKGNLWVSVLNKGIARLDFEQGEIRSYTSFPQHGTSMFRAAVEDRDGDIWITSSEGIVVLDPARGTSIFFRGNDGLMSGKFREFSLCMASDGIMYAGLYDGMVSFNHELFKKSDRNIPELVFTGTHLLGNLGDELKYVDMSQNRIVLAHNQNSLQIGVSDVTYSKPRKNTLQYKVEGLNKEWVPVYKGKITLSGLTKGTYTLRVRSMRLDGTFCNNEITKVIVIKPHIMASLPALAIYVLLFFSIMVAVERLTRRRSVCSAREAARRESEKFEVQRQKQYYASKVEFLMNIAHEIRTPLTLIKGPIDELIQRYSASSNKDLVNELQVIGRNSDKLSQLLDELLDFKKINSTGYELKLADYNVNNLVQVVFDRFQLVAKNKGVRYELELPKEPISCKVDKIAIDKILSNLLANAMKYSSSDVRLKLFQVNKTFKIVLENDGPVVPLESRERIFKPFERCVDQSCFETGTGIGLYVSRNFAELLSGSLEMDNDETLNRFILTIPIVEVDTDDDAEESMTSLPYLDIPQSRRSIFVVEDSDDMREFITRQLSSTYHVVAVRNGREALEILERSANTLPDIIISDVMMPEIDGLQLCREIKKNPATKHITFIMLSALADDTSKLQGLKYGADAYMTKPFSIQELLVVVQNQLNLRDAIAESEGNTSETSEQSTHEHNVKVMKIVDEYVQQHLEDESLNVEKLAEVACVSVSSLFKKMKATIGVSPNEFILISRLKKATDLLKDENMSIEQVSIKTGFRSHAYFSTCFKKQFGMSPSSYREKINHK